MDWKAALKTLVPIILPIVFPPAAPAVPFIVHAIDVAENLGGTGQEKLAKAIDITNAGIDTANTLGAKIDKQQINSIAVQAIGTAVSIANLVHNDTN